jgi:uracil-DNA glycosylase
MSTGKQFMKDRIVLELDRFMPQSWLLRLSEEFSKTYFKNLELFLAGEMERYKVYPQLENIFAAFRHTSYDGTRVLILGQDPYHNEGQAQGLSFSVPVGVTSPPSLKNIFKELETDLGCKVPNNGNLLSWAEQGVLLLNAVLTVRAGEAASHKNQGWERFTDAVIGKINEKQDSVVFLLWGDYAKKKRKLIDESKHVVIEGVHPSPLSARNGFFGSKPFSRINEALKKAGSKEIDWQIPIL